MDYSLETFTFQKEWGIIINSIIAVFMLFILFKLIKNVFEYFRNYTYSKPCTMTRVKGNPFLIYALYLWSCYKQSRPNCPLLCLFLQLMLGGCCEVYEKERIFLAHLGRIPVIYLYKPDTIEAVLSRTTLIDKSFPYKVMHSWLGAGLFTSSGEKWRKRRKLLTPTFHFSILEDFIPVVQEQSNVFVSKLKELTSKQWVDIVPLAVSCTLDIICETAMGISMNAQSNGNKEYVQAINEITEAVVNRILCPWLYPDIIYYLTSDGKKYKENLKCVNQITRKVIKDKKARMLSRDHLKREAENIDLLHSPDVKRKPFLELLLEQHFNDPAFTEEHVRDEVNTFMFAGHDTSGMAISFTLYCIGLYPEVQKKIFEELDEIFQNDKIREVTREDLTNMKYLECTIKETFRLYPPAPFFARECNETFDILGHTVYPGTFCLIFPYALHRDRESFPDPEKFIPDRFFPENSRGRHPYAFIPFSAGPRNCLGQKFAMLELKTVLANVLRCFRVTSLDPRDKVLLTPNIVLRNTMPLRLRFETR